MFLVRNEAAICGRLSEPWIPGADPAALTAEWPAVRVAGSRSGP